MMVRPLANADMPSPESWAFLGAAVAGCLHAVAMALRKKFGQVTPYYSEPRWWLGVLTDGLAGLVFSLLTPLLAVEILLLTTCASQLACAYVLGLYMFNEPGNMWQRLGFGLTCTSVLLLSFSKQEKASPTTHFWSMWLQPHFFLVLVSWVVVAGVCFVMISDKNGYAVLAAYVDGIQFLFTRAISQNILQGFHMDASFWEFGACKAACVLAVLHLQQCALADDNFVGFKSIGTVLPVLQNLTTVTLGATFFGDVVKVAEFTAEEGTVGVPPRVALCLTKGAGLQTLDAMAQVEVRYAWGHPDAKNDYFGCEMSSHLLV
ncbi:unnamed protein product [Symbiodinium natans]|uniref:Magnesium transporter n=1 Tax=Symbiodinium natans TaxID=878477 RepID=A0A812QAL6_9DINO|nr:unnamed protein product [Symbiodinium natans]